MSTCPSDVWYVLTPKCDLSRSLNLTATQAMSDRVSAVSSVVCKMPVKMVSERRRSTVRSTSKSHKPVMLISQSTMLPMRLSCRVSVRPCTPIPRQSAHQPQARYLVRNLRANPRRSNKETPSSFSRHRRTSTCSRHLSRCRLRCYMSAL